MNQKFPSSEKLKSKIVIDKLFTEGNSIKHFPIKLIYLPLINPEIGSCKTGVSVPKRNFKKAVDRNFLKRLMREGFRKNKYIVEGNLTNKYAFMFIFTAHKRYDQQEISDCIVQILNKLIEREAAHENSTI